MCYIWTTETEGLTRKVSADSMIEFLADHFANSLMSDLSKGPQVSGY